MTEHVALMPIPRVIISGLSGGSGKTLVSLGLARAFTKLGHRVKTFKKGPDYIDAAWLASSAMSAQGTLDPYFSSAQELMHLFLCGSSQHTLSIIEGNRGLFDGLDAQGSCSTAYLAKTLHAPVILVIDCTKMTRTAAAIIHGCNTFDPELTLCGVILNRVKTARQKELICESLEGRMPVLGVLPNNKEPFIKERHMGLQCIAGNTQAQHILTKIEAFITNNLNLQAIENIATQAPPFVHRDTPQSTPQSCLELESSRDEEKKQQWCKAKECSPSLHRKKPTIGYVFDASLWFYYHENLHALADAGATLAPLSLLSPDKWPKLDGLYLGGGLPELYASELSLEKHHKKTILSMAHDGLPLYAECGGLIYLANTLTLKKKHYDMAGVLPIEIGFDKKPRALGYVSATSVIDNPFHPKGCFFRGHEFHFSYCNSPIPVPMSLCITRGEGLGETTQEKGETKENALLKKDGLLIANTFASYMHIYAPAVPHWASCFVSACKRKTL